MGATKLVGAIPKEPYARIDSPQTVPIEHGPETCPEGVPEMIEPLTEGIQESSQQKDENIDGCLVDWDGPNDPANPMNWSPKFKWANCILISFYTFITYATSTFLLAFISGLIKSTVH